jgi:hypothetical protein
MGIGISFILGFLVQLQSHELETKLQTRSGLFERIVYDQDERQFDIKLTKPNGEVVWLERHLNQKKYSGKVSRQSIDLFSNAGFEAVILTTEKGTQLLGLSPQRFEKDCSATARVQLPTPFFHPDFYSLSGLSCDDKQEPTSEFSWLKVLGRDAHSWLQCEMKNNLCEWNSRYPESSEAAAEAAALTFLWRAQGELNVNGFNAFMPKLLANAWSGPANESSYEREKKTLYYGTGKFPDALDGFIVVHEWAHSLIDQINSGFYGYQGRVLHEALADFYATHLFDSACFAPFDAQEVDGRKCVRDLENEIHFPKDLKWNDPHEDSVALSGALWESRKILPKSILLELVLESVFRLPKNPSLPEFWDKMEAAYARLIKDRSLLEDQSAALHQIRQRWGFVQ